MTESCDEVLLLHEQLLVICTNNWITFDEALHGRKEFIS
jgi:hypothetical protein